MSGLTIPRYFTSENQHPYDAVAWEVRDAVITRKDGQPVFEASGVEFPAFWSQRATDIVASKYFRIVDGECETSVRQMLDRVVSTIGQWGHEDAYFADRVGYTSSCSKVFCDELTHILLHQYAAFNSPVWFNVGIQPSPQTSACYILDVEDSMESILEWYRQEGMIFKGGSGSGVNLSKIRAKGSPLSRGGTASGVMSFARVADANAGAIKSGGTTRRAAKMLVLDVNHPEIEDFIQCKVDAEKLARTLILMGYGNGIEGGAYDQVPWQNANNSVSVPDVFMQFAESPDATIEVTPAIDMLYKISKATWKCGDPSLFFYDTINAWHTTPQRGPITSGNPCQEFLRPPNEACNLASLNLLKFLEDDGSFNIPAFIHTVDIMITAMDILIDRSSYPTETIAQNSRDYRPLGLGYANLGALLMAKGLPYDSNVGRTFATAITSLLTARAYRRSAEIAQVKDAFSSYDANATSMLHVIDRHFSAQQVEVELPTDAYHWIRRAAYEYWCEASGLGMVYGFRNCQVTVLAPCGTISFMMDCDTTGIEPCLGLDTTKKLVGDGELRMMNGVVRRALHAHMGRRPRAMQTVLDYINEHGTPVGCDEMSVEDCTIFATALGDNAISWQGHIKMVAAVQPFISGGISKTINMPHDATVDDVLDAYIMAWKMGLKAISIYRDGSKGVQPVTVNALRVLAGDNTPEETLSDAQRYNVKFEERVQKNMELRKNEFSDIAQNIQQQLQQIHTSKRHRLPDERCSITHKFSINTHEGYLTVGLYDDGSPGELFVRMAKEGSTLGGIMDAWATAMSIGLQYGIPLDVFIKKFRDGQYEPRGFTGNPKIQIATSITDYIVRWLELKFGRTEVKPSWAWIHGGDETSAQHVRDITGIPDLPVSTGVFPSHVDTQVYVNSHIDALPLCSECGNMTIRNGSCCVCVVCGTTTGCS